MSETSTSAPRYKPGDQLRNFQGVICEIVDVRPTGYGWKYPDLDAITPSGGENYFWSENSTDPLLNGLGGWRLLAEHERISPAT